MYTLLQDSFKYAFDKSDIIEIRTYLQDGFIYMLISDNAKGFKENHKESVGLTIVKTLGTKQLQAECHVKCAQGVFTTIFWRDIS